MFRSINALGVIILVAVVFGLGVWGYSLCPADVQQACVLPGVQDRITDAFKLFLKGGADYPYAHPPWQLLVARYVGPYIIPFVAVFAAVKVALYNMRRDMRVAMARSKRRHFIVCGLGETGMQIVQNLCDAGESVVAVDLVGDSPNAVAVERQGVPVLKGDASRKAVLRQAGVLRANAVILCTGKDTVNVDVALRIRNGGVERRAASLGPLTVLVELRDEWLFAKLIEHDREPLGTARVDVRPFNIYVNAARLLIKSLQPQPAHDKAAKPILIFGFSSMGREALLHILRAAPAPLGHANQIVVFDRDAELQGQRFHATFPMLAGDAAVEFVTLDAEADTPAAWQLVEERMRTAPPLMVAVCLPDDRASLFVALEVRVRLDKLGQFNVPVFVHLEQHQCLGTFAAEIERMEPYQDRLRAFGSLEDMLTPDILVGAQLDKLAEAFHQNYLASRPAGSAANAGARPWRELPEQYKVSNRRTADHTAVKLAQAGFRIEASASPKLLEFTVEEIELLARLEHRLWIIERRMLGWNYGATRDDGRRLNPNLIEWERLPEEMRGYNREATQAIPKILAAAGLEIRRNVQ